MADSGSGMIMMLMAMVVIVIVLFKDKIMGMMGGGGGSDEMMEAPAPEEMPIPVTTTGAFTQDLLDCAKRCNQCDDVIDPDTGQVFWHAARTNDEQRCFSCLRDKCRFLFPQKEKNTIVKIINKIIKPKNGNDRHTTPGRPSKPKPAPRNNDSNDRIRSALAMRRYY